MTHTVVRPVLRLLTALIVTLSVPSAGWAQLPGRPTLIVDPGSTHHCWWAQWIVKDRVRFFYNPNDFAAGANAAYVDVEAPPNEKLAIDFANSDFAQEGGLSKKNIAQELNGFYVRIPSDARTGDYAYHIKFACARSSRDCPTGVFYVPVKHPNDHLLDASLKASGLRVPVVGKGAQVELGLHARKTIGRVRIINDPGQWNEAGVDSVELVRASAENRKGIDSAAEASSAVCGVDTTSLPVPSNGPIETSVTAERIVPGEPFLGWAKVTANKHVYWNRLVSDWEGIPPRLSLMFEYYDEYDRRWVLQLAPMPLEYQLPSWAVLPYYLIFLGLATALGIGARVIAGVAISAAGTTNAVGTVSTLRIESLARAFAAAGVLFVIGHVLRARIEPVGLFQLDVTTLRGILATGLVAGFLPELIGGRIQALLGTGSMSEPGAGAASGDRRVAPDSPAQRSSVNGDARGAAGIVDGR